MPFWINCFANPLRLACRKGFGYGEVRKMREVRRRARGQAGARREAISPQARMSRARLATRKVATDSHEISQRSPQLVGKWGPLSDLHGAAHLLSQVSPLTLYSRPFIRGKTALMGLKITAHLPRFPA